MNIIHYLFPVGTLKRFGKIRLAVYGWEHGRIHFHVSGPGYDCSLDLESLEVLAGHAPPRALRLAREWAAANRPAIAKAWKELNP